MSILVRLLAWALAIGLVALPVVAVLNGWIAGDRWPMRKLEVHGPFQQVSAEEVRAVVLPQVKSGFFAVRMEPIRDSLAKLPWVERVEVRKRWPDQLVVSLTEHKAFARWGRDKLLSGHAQVFTAPGSPDLSKLPQLEGPDGRAAEVIALYNQVQPMFAGSGRQVEGVSLSERDSWTVHLNDGVDVVIGRTDPKERLRRFARLIPQIANARQGSTLLRADLRYTNGFTLTWNDPAPAKPAGPKHPAPNGTAKPPAHTASNDTQKQQAHT